MRPALAAILNAMRLRAGLAGLVACALLLVSFALPSRAADPAQGPGGPILVVTSDRYRGDVPWSERVANTLEPILWDWAPPSPPYPGRIEHPVFVRSTSTALAR